MIGVVNVNNTQSVYSFEISKDVKFVNNVVSLTGNAFSADDITLIKQTDPLLINDIYYYKLTVNNKNGTAISDIQSLSTFVPKVISGGEQQI